MWEIGKSAVIKNKFYYNNKSPCNETVAEMGFPCMGMRTLGELRFYKIGAPRAGEGGLSNFCANCPSLLFFHYREILIQLRS